MVWDTVYGPRLYYIGKSMLYLPDSNHIAHSMIIGLCYNPGGFTRSAFKQNGCYEIECLSVR